MKKTVLTLSLLAALAVSPFAVAQNAAVVNGKAIPKAKLDSLLRNAGDPNNAELRKRAREMLIDRELLTQEATKRGVTQRDDVQEQIEQARLNVIVAALFEDYIKREGASDAELRAQYDKIKTQFGNGKEYRARHILVEKESEAKALISQLKGGASFEELAKKSSKDPGSGANGGDLDWANPNGFVPEFSAAMTGLTKGKMTETPVKTQFGWHIIKLEDVRDAKMPSFEELKPQLLQMMAQDQNWQREKFQAMLKSLRDRSKIQ